MHHLQPNTTLQGGKYRIKRVLGQGGFGITYLAIDIALDKQVAIKEFFPKDYCDRNESTSHMTLGTASATDLVLKLKAKFLKEVRNIAKLDHPGIIKIHAAFEENNTAYYVMDYIEGENLSDMVRRNGSLSAERALYYIEKVGEALQYIHDRNINHLDIKPANIMVRREGDSPILIDFGLSKQYDSEGQQTSTTPTGISHGYAPMEQYNDGGVKEFSPQTDIYSLAATLYFLLSGVTPPQATKLVDEELTFPQSIPANLIAPISKAMATSRKRRYDTVGKFIEELTTSEDTIIEPIPSKTLGTQPTKKGTGTTPHKPSTKHGNMKWLKVALVGIVIIGGLITGALLLQDTLLADTENNKQPYTGYINGHEWVDLGLPSGLKWATCNIGASSPSDYGDYFAWGETMTKSEYAVENCKTIEQEVGDISGSPQYDAARANWGGSWRLPSEAECEELENKCTWTWTPQGGHNGYQVTGPNGNSIFLPAAGFRLESSLYGAGDNGYYWSSTPFESYSQRAYYLYFLSSDHYVYRYSRDYGQSVRPVSE